MKHLAPMLAVCVSMAPALASAQTPAGRQPLGPLEHRSSEITTLGPRFDVGSAWSYGLGFLRVRQEHTQRRNGLGGSVWWGGGVDLRAHGRDFGTLDALQINAVGRLSFMGCSGAGLEATLGVAQAVGGPDNGSPRTVAVGSLGVFMGMHYMLLGYSYQVPLGPFERPEWLSSHQFSVRVEIPVARSRERLRVDPE